MTLVTGRLDLSGLGWAYRLTTGQSSFWRLPNTLVRRSQSVVKVQSVAYDLIVLFLFLFVKLKKDAKSREIVSYDMNHHSPVA